MLKTEQYYELNEEIVDFFRFKKAFYTEIVNNSHFFKNIGFVLSLNSRRSENSSRTFGNQNF
jgi:hypothetical protein